MADNFGLRIGIEGEKEFKKALADINQSFKVLGSEMKVVSSQFDKNDKSVQALSARNTVLNKEIDAQKQKIETLRAALQNASESFGENDRRTQNWQIQLNNATATLNDMERELDRNNQALDEAEREMDDVADSADDMGEELDDAGDSAEKNKDKFEKLGSVLKGIGAAMGAVAVAAGAAAVKLGKEVIAAYSDYEQLVGGVDTLFKENSKELQTYAANAYKTAGLSANDYMETVTSFSASLIQSLGGDTEKAVKYADMAITDMSDNANKMGTDMASIQNAYQGFAKQNYTMLDNLKLGYGGTKEEMQRLLSDAEKISGIKYDISSYADVVDAIHVMQESMGIAGTTAAEAEKTISGSINSLQAALQNMLVGFGNADADMSLLCQNMVDALKNVITNITPVIENIIKVLPTVTGALLEAFADLLPSLLATVTDLFTQVLNTILTLLPQLIPAAVQAVMTIVQAIIDNLPLLVDASQTARAISISRTSSCRAVPLQRDGWGILPRLGGRWMAEFVRLAEVVNKKKDMRVVSVTVIPTITDCSGRIWFTDLQLQEGSNLTGYALHTETMLRKYREGGVVKAPVWYNGIVRSKETVILFNLGKTSAPLDIHIYPKSGMAAGTVKLSQGAGGQQASFRDAVSAEDDVALLAESRVCTKNGVPFQKEGFFQYSAAWDSKHNVEVEKGKTAKLLFEMQEMSDADKHY